MTLTFFTISYITLNILTAVLSVVGIGLQCSDRHTAICRTGTHTLGIIGLYNIGSLLLWYMAPLAQYYVLAFPFSILLGPAIYFLSLGKQGKCLKRKDWMHVLPFVLILPFYLVFVSNNNVRYDYYDLYYTTLHFLSFISLLSYCTWSALLWSEQSQAESLPDRRGVTGLETSANGGESQGKSSSLLFLRKGLGIVLFFSVCSVLLLVTSRIWKGSFYMDIHGFAHTFFYLITLFVVWEIVREGRLREGHKLKACEREGALRSSCTSEGHRSGDQRQQACDSVRNEAELPGGITLEQQQLYKRNVELFIQKKGFADPDLNRDKFIEKTKIHSRHLGPFLQSYYGNGFSAFINKLRLEHAVQELSKSNFEHTVDDLSLACGFRSRASFYRNFTAEFGCSPLEYRTSNLMAGVSK